MWALVSQLEAVHVHAHDEGIEQSSTHKEDGAHKEDEHSDEEDHDHAK
jgi:hypothetical protein